jgi:hypothetical protein
VPDATVTIAHKDCPGRHERIRAEGDIVLVRCSFTETTESWVRCVVEYEPGMRCQAFVNGKARNCFHHRHEEVR